MKKLIRFGFVLFCVLLLSGCVNSITYDNVNYPSSGTIEMKLENLGDKIDFSNANDESILRIKDGSYIRVISSLGETQIITDLKISDINKAEETAILSFDYYNLSPDLYTIDGSKVVFEYLEKPTSRIQEKKLDIRCSNTFEVRGKIECFATGYDGGYDGKEHGISVNPDSSIETTIKYGLTKDNITLDECPTYKDVGTYTVYYSISANHYDTVTGSETVVIHKSTIQYSIDDITVVYDGNPHSPIINTEALVSIQYGLTENNITLDTIPSFVDAGEYKIFYKMTGDNYEPVTSHIDFVIKEKEIEYEANGANVIFDGQEYGAVITVKNVDNAVIKYGTDYNDVTLMESPKYKNLGIYTIYYTISAPNHETTAGSVKIAITRDGISDELLYKDEYINKVGEYQDTSIISIIIIGVVGICTYSFVKKKYKK